MQRFVIAVCIQTLSEKILEDAAEPSVDMLVQMIGCMPKETLNFPCSTWIVN
jgi:hypothetical protein